MNTTYGTLYDFNFISIYARMLSPLNIEYLAQVGNPPTKVEGRLREKSNRVFKMNANMAMIITLCIIC